MGDLDAAAEWAKTDGKGDPARLGVTGFCWGGRITWLYAAHNPDLKAGVAWYSRLAEVRYEELTKDLVGGMRRVYEGLELGGFEAVRPELVEYAARNRGYEANKYQLTDEQRAKIAERWGM